MLLAVKSRRLQWAEHVGRVEETRNFQRILESKHVENSTFEDEKGDGRITLR
jgi:hypothetical protein